VKDNGGGHRLLRDSPATQTAILDERRPGGVERIRPALTPALFFLRVADGKSTHAISFSLTPRG